MPSLTTEQPFASHTVTRAGGTEAMARAVDTLLRDYGDYFPDARRRPRLSTVSVVRRRLSQIARVELVVDGAALGIYVKVHTKAGQSHERRRGKVVVGVRDPAVPSSTVQ